MKSKKVSNTKKKLKDSVVVMTSPERLTQRLFEEYVIGIQPKSVVYLKFLEEFLTAADEKIGRLMSFRSVKIKLNWTVMCSLQILC
jgi:hypothetical protein